MLALELGVVACLIVLNGFFAMAEQGRHIAKSGVWPGSGQDSPAQPCQA
jgi:hypothetical protein